MEITHSELNEIIRKLSKLEVEVNELKLRLSEQKEKSNSFPFSSANQE